MDNKVLNPFLKRVKLLMNDLDWSQTRLALEAGVRETTVRSWFSRNTYPTVDNAHLIADALNTTVDYLVTGQDPERKFEDPLIAEMIDYLEGLTANQLQQTYGMLKLAKAISLTEEKKGDHADTKRA